MRKLTNLEHALLALLAAAPQSGYEIRKSFATTPLGHYSDSPGSIYPALGRLRKRGLLRAVREAATSRRKRVLLEASALGKRVLREWLQTPLTRAEVQSNPGDVMLRFAFRAHVLGRESAQKFAGEIERETLETGRRLELYLAGAGRTLPIGGRLAVEQGLEEYRAMAAWAKRAAQELGRS